MPYSIYESIDNNQPSLVHAFVAPIENSAFHWHNEYELIGVLSGSINVRIQSRLLHTGKAMYFLSSRCHTCSAKRRRGKLMHGHSASPPVCLLLM